MITTTVWMFNRLLKQNNLLRSSTALENDFCQIAWGNFMDEERNLGKGGEKFGILVALESPSVVSSPNTTM